MEPFIGEIKMFGGNFAPRGWALCDGQLLSIASNSALFSILGTIYGGDGVSTFGLPDMRGRVSVHAGNGPGLSPRSLGEKGGQETVTLTTQQVPSHTHTAIASGGGAHSASPEGSLAADSGEGVPAYGTDDPKVNMDSGAIGNTGGGQPHPNLQPFVTVNFIVALQGVYPSRN